VVDDAEPVRTTTARALEHGGYRCLATSSAAEALDLVAAGRERVDLVLTDVVMPGMSGRELADRLWELHPTLPVIFVSGYTEEDILRRGLLDRGRPFLPKPFTPHGLVAKVGEVLERGRATPSEA
jgi:CheY-like chemotaxis protein